MLKTSMASTPSTSALSAVLRCRGNILTRNPPTKRASGLGLAGASPAERGRSSKASAREAFLHGDRVRALGTTPSAARASPRARGKTFREIDPREINKPRHAHSDTRAVQNALVRQLERRLKTSNLPGTHACSQITQKIIHATHVGEILPVRKEPGGFPVGVLKVSVASPRFLDDAGRISSFVLTGWSTLRSTCSSLTALVLLKLTVLWRSSSRSSSTGLPGVALQASGQSTQSPADVTCSEDQDRPD